MKIFDFNIHFPCNLSTDVNRNILNDNSMSLKELKLCYSNYTDKFKFNIQSGNFMLFNQNIFFEDDLTPFISQVKSDFVHSYFTALIDFRKYNVLEYLDRAIENGIDAIKFHSYNQKISNSDFIEIVKICKYAEEKELFICIDTSYGTSKMYEFDNLKLACFISDFITKAPIVLLHSGGTRVLEVMLLAEEKKNIYLDTSFSIPYLLGSSKEQDFAFAYKKIGSHRILYGSDSPYVEIKDSINITVDFLEKYHFSNLEIENILFKNAIHIKELSNE